MGKVKESLACAFEAAGLQIEKLLLTDKWLVIYYENGRVSVIARGESKKAKKAA